MSLILMQQEEGIATLTLNNPDNLNAMTEAMGLAIQEKVAEINENKTIRVVLLTGAGRAFSAGGDLQFLLDSCENSIETNQKAMVQFYQKFLSLRKIEVPTIAMLHGPAIGAGLLIALACDLRYACPKAKMGANFAKIGLSSGMGGLYWLTKLAGPAVAAELLFTGKIFNAEEALKLGLINNIFESEDLKNQVRQVAQLIAANAPLPLKIIKKGVQMAVTASLEEVFEYESQGQAQCFATQDLIEGVMAVKEKRSANFSGT